MSQSVKTKVNSRADRPDGEPVVTVVEVVGIAVARIEEHVPRVVDVAREDLARPVVAAGANVFESLIEPVAVRRQENGIIILL